MCLIEAEFCKAGGTSITGRRKGGSAKAYGDTGKGELHRELLHVLGELPERGPALSVRLGDRLDEVLEELAPGLGLSLQRNLHGAVEEVGDDLHLGLLHRARGEGVHADAHATGHGRRLVALDRVLVECDVCEVADLLDLGTGEAERAEVPEDEVVVGATSLELVRVRVEDLGDGLRCNASVGRPDVPIK